MAILASAKPDSSTSSVVFGGTLKSTFTHTMKYGGNTYIAQNNYDYLVFGYLRRNFNPFNYSSVTVTADASVSGYFALYEFSSTTAGARCAITSNGSTLSFYKSVLGEYIIGNTKMSATTSRNTYKLTFKSSGLVTLAVNGTNKASMNLSSYKSYFDKNAWLSFGNGSKVYANGIILECSQILLPFDNNIITSGTYTTSITGETFYYISKCSTTDNSNVVNYVTEVKIAYHRVGGLYIIKIRREVRLAPLSL